MGIYIKNMRMPTCCAECEFINMSNILKKDICNRTYKQIEDEWVRAEFCPLIEIKEPHGRLIDADALAKDVTENALHDPNNLDWIEISSVIALIAMNAVIERSEDDKK